MENGFFVSSDVSTVLTRVGAVILGPAPSVVSGIEMAKRSSPDGAIIDIRIDGDLVYPMVEFLSERRIPFVFAVADLGIPVDTVYGGYVLSNNLAELQEIAKGLFGQNT
ncbi:hypothetical protein ACIQUB_24630 [Rhizobium sp. NPDC090275]|uniref:hypothetical protein n=1 Tax=Rhizobium sp. NPDC090275 TaxID=3364498 RepID=UPI00383B4B17